MTVYKVDNIYYNDESIQQYLQENHSFSDFVSLGLKDVNGNLRDLLNKMFQEWNGENPDQVSNYLNVLNYMYVSYINTVLSNIPTFTLIEGGEQPSTNKFNQKNISEDIEPVVMQSEHDEDEQE